VPTLILHGDDDQIVPIGASAMLSSKIVKNAALKVYKGARHVQYAQESGQTRISSRFAKHERSKPLTSDC